jgi:hypothetical protein
MQKNFFGNLAKKLLFDPPDLKRLLKHADQVCFIVSKLIQALRAYVEGQDVEYDEIARLEYEADEVKQEIRSHLPRTDLLLPIARTDLLDFLWQQDQIADACQDTVGLMSLMPVPLNADLKAKLLLATDVLEQGMNDYPAMIKALFILLDGSFEKSKVEDLWRQIDAIMKIEHDADVVGLSLMRTVYQSTELDSFQKYHLVQIIKRLGEVTDHMQDAGDRLRIMTAR